MQNQDRVTFFSGEQIPLEMHKVRMVQRIKLPRVEERKKAIEEAGNNTFLLHNSDVFLDMLTESGVNAIQCVDPLAGMDIIRVKRQLYGKTAVIGNVDCSILQNGAKEEIERAVKSVVEGCKGDGGFVLSGCNSIFKGISAENYQVMVDARYKYGRETYP